MKRRAFLLLLMLAAAVPLIGQTHDDHDDEAVEATAVAAAPEPRPGWAWPAALLLAGAAALVPAGARRWGWRPAVPTAALALGALAVLAGTEPRVAAAVGEPAHDDHAAEEHGIIEVDPEAAAALGLRTEVVGPSKVQTVLRATGRVVVDETRQVHLGPMVAGRLTGLDVRVGQRVRAGQVVATLDSLDAAQAAAQAREARSRVTVAERHLAAQRALVASGALTVAPLEDARRVLSAARVEQAKASTELAQARNEAEAARAERARTERLIEGGSYTTAALGEARDKLATAQRELANAEAAAAQAQTEQAVAADEVRLAEGRARSTEEAVARAHRLVGTGEVDRAPLEAARAQAAAAQAALTAAETALAQAQRQAERGEALYASELVSLNDLEARRATLRAAQAERDRAQSAARDGDAALSRAQGIADAGLAGGATLAEAEAEAAAATRELAAARSRLAQFATQATVVARAVGPAEAAVEVARETLAREQALATDGTRAETERAAAALRVDQAQRLVEGREAEADEAGRAVDVASAGLRREEALAREQLRGREVVLAAERELASARVAADHAREMLALLGAPSTGARGPVRLPLRAPQSGVVTAITANVGEAVGAETVVLTIVDLSEVYVEADVYEQDLRLVERGQAVHATISALGDEGRWGEVSAISGELDEVTRAAHVRTRLANADWTLRPGMFAQLEFQVAAADAAISVAETAVQQVEGEDVVFVQHGPDQYELRPVTLAASDGQRREVTAGLRAGEVVATEGSYLLKSEHLAGELSDGHAH